MLYSIKHLDRKQILLNELMNQQAVHNHHADELLKKQKLKLKSLQQKNSDLYHNTISMEYLVKHLNLDKIVHNLGKAEKLVETKSNFNQVQEEDHTSKYEVSLSAGELRETEYQEMMARMEKQKRETGMSKYNEEVLPIQQSARMEMGNETEINFDNVHRIRDVDNIEEIQETVEQLKSQS